MCEALTSPNICPIATQLEEIFVNKTQTDCNLPHSQVIFSSCLKCANLTLFNAGGNVQQEIVSVALIANETNNVFTICDDTTTAKAEFNATIDATNLIEAQKAV